MREELIAEKSKFIAERIARLRTQKGVSARDMSLSIGQAENYINNIENQRAIPSMPGFFYILDYFGIDELEFYRKDTDDPVTLREVTDEIRPLDRETQQHILQAIIGIKKHRD